MGTVTFLKQARPRSALRAGPGWPALYRDSKWVLLADLGGYSARLAIDPEAASSTLQPEFPLPGFRYHVVGEGGWMGEFRFARVDAAPDGCDGVLGQDFLARRRVLIDPSRNRLWIANIEPI